MKGKLEVDLINKSKDALIKSRLGTQDVFGFEGQSKLYSDYRPTYPQFFIDKVSSELSNKNVMLDVGCGTGQLCKPFASIFNRIYGIDVSESQLNIAKEKNKDFENVNIKDKKKIRPVKIQIFVCLFVSFHFQNSNDMLSFHKGEMNDEKIDLVTFGQVLHWLDYNSIFKQYKDLMAADAAMAIFSYATPCIVNNKLIETITKQKEEGSSIFDLVEINNLQEESKYPEEDSRAHDAFWKFYTLIRPHFECDRDYLDLHYGQINFGEYFSNVKKYLYYDIKTLSLFNFQQYLKTMSGYRCYLEKLPDEKDPLQVLIEEWKDIYGFKEDQDIDEQFSSKMIDIVYPYFLGIMKY